MIHRSKAVLKDVTDADTREAVNEGIDTIRKSPIFS